MLALGLSIGAGYYLLETKTNNNKPEKATVEASIASNPTLSNVSTVNTEEATNEVMSKEMKSDTIVSSEKVTGTNNRRKPEIVDDS